MGCGISCPTETEPKKNPTLYYTLTSNTPGALKVPEPLQGWLPRENVDENVYKKFTWHKEVGDGVTSSVFQVSFNSELCALKRIEVSLIYLLFQKHNNIRIYYYIF